MAFNLTRRALLGVLGAAVAIPAGAQQAAFATKPITFILPFAAGGATDSLARMIGEKLQTRVGQPVVVDSRPGGNTLIATKYVMSQKPDGHVLYFMSSTAIEQPAVRPTAAKFDPVEDLTPITHLAKLAFVLVVRPDFPANNFAEFLQVAKARPDGLSMATIGTGAADHLASELISLKTGVKLLAVPYKGASPALLDVASGVVDARIGDFASAQAFIESGRLRVIASADLKRTPGSALPTISETVPGVEVPVWFALMGPKGMPPAVVSQLNEHIVQIMQMPDIQAKVRFMGMEPGTTTPEQLRTMVKERYAEVRRIVKERKIAID